MTNHLVHGKYGFLRYQPEPLVEHHGMSASIFAVKKCALGNDDGKHFLQAQGLSAKLHFVAAVLFGPAAFIFDRKNQTVVVKLHHIGLPAQSQALGADRQGPHGADPALLDPFSAVGPFMEKSPFGGVTVLGPDLLGMDQGALAGAIQIMLQCREHDVVGFWVHRHFYFPGLGAYQMFTILDPNLLYKLTQKPSISSGLKPSKWISSKLPSGFTSRER